MQALARQTWPDPQEVPSATALPTQDWTPVVVSHAVR